VAVEKTCNALRAKTRADDSSSHPEGEEHRARLEQAAALNKRRLPRTRGKLATNRVRGGRKAINDA